MRRLGHRTSAGVVAIVLLAFMLASCSAPPTFQVSVSHGQTSVTYGGITVEVPASWSVTRRSDAVCGIPGPGVLVGPPRPESDFVQSCPGIPLKGVVVTFGGPDPIAPVGHEQRKTIHGLHLAISERIDGSETTGSGVTHWLWREVVRFPGYSVWLQLDALGTSTGVPAAVAEVVNTVRLG